MSFLAKYQHDAAAASAKSPQYKKLSGAARNSSEKKCVNDVVGVSNGI